MLNMIGDIVHEYRRRTEACTSNELAELILCAIENKGMLPPTVAAGTALHKIQSDSDGSIMQTRLGWDVNQWQPEEKETCDNSC